jgi:hypothetical protein
VLKCKRKFRCQRFNVLIVLNLRASNSWKPQGLSMAVMELLWFVSRLYLQGFLYCVIYVIYICYICVCVCECIPFNSRVFDPWILIWTSVFVQLFRERASKPMNGWRCFWDCSDVSPRPAWLKFITRSHTVLKKPCEIW